MEKEKFITLERNRKDYKQKGYKNLNCDSFFQSFDPSIAEEELLTQGYLSLKTINSTKEQIFFVSYEESDGSKYYTTCDSVRIKILEKLFPTHSLESLSKTGIKLRLLERKVNKFDIDTVLFEVSPAENPTIDFIPVCIIAYKLETPYINTWRKFEYIPGDNLGIYVPIKYNTVSRYRQGLIKGDMMDTWIEVIEAIHPGIFDKVEEYLPDEEDCSDFDRYALEVIYNLMTGDTIPEVKYDLEKLKESLNLIQC